MRRFQLQRPPQAATWGRMWSFSALSIPTILSGGITLLSAAGLGIAATSNDPTNGLVKDLFGAVFGCSVVVCLCTARNSIRYAQIQVLRQAIAEQQNVVDSGLALVDNVETINGQMQQMSHEASERSHEEESKRAAYLNVRDTQVVELGDISTQIAKTVDQLKSVTEVLEKDRKNSPPLPDFACFANREHESRLVSFDQQISATASVNLKGFQTLTTNIQKIQTDKEALYDYSHKQINALTSLLQEIGKEKIDVARQKQQNEEILSQIYQVLGEALDSLSAGLNKLEEMEKSVVPELHETLNKLKAIFAKGKRDLQQFISESPSHSDDSPVSSRRTPRPPAVPTAVPVPARSSHMSRTSQSPSNEPLHDFREFEI